MKISPPSYFGRIDFICHARLKKSRVRDLARDSHTVLHSRSACCPCLDIMGTLTADQTRLPEYCEHKLPTSCRLTSIPTCCACADERVHSASYSTYIDGIGFVPRGNRWQRYCWFCKEFWENRVRVSGLRPAQTRIPAVPDQTEFLKKWYEFHRGYRIVRKEDGSEDRVAVLGEEFKEVSPGCLPRTLEELRSGSSRDEQVRHVQQQGLQEQEETGESLEDTLEQMILAASSESNDQHPAQTSARSRSLLERHHRLRSLNSDLARTTNIHAQSMNPAGTRNREYQARRVAALRRELHRMRNGIERVISGLRDLGENVPDHSQATNRLIDLGRTLDTISGVPSREDAERAISSVNELTTDTGATSQTDRTMANIQARVDEARTHLNEARRSRDQAASELDLAESEFGRSQHRQQQLQREQRTTENYMRIFGTREEMLAQGENYESPIGGMFSRAYERFHAAEEVRQVERNLRQVLEDEATAGREDEVTRLAELEAGPRDVWGVAQLPSINVGTSTLRAAYRITNDAAPGTPAVLSDPAENAMLQEYNSMLEQENRRPQASATEGQDVPRRSNENFPRNMLNAIIAARQREEAEQDGVVESVEGREALAEADTDYPNEAPLGGFSQDEWWDLSASHTISSIYENSELCTELGMFMADAQRLRHGIANEMLSESDRTTIDALLRNDKAVWGTGLPAEWLRIRKEYVQNNNLEFDHMWFAFDSDVPGSRDWANYHNPYMFTELIAQAFQMSSAVRRRAQTLSPPERLQMLYRLQAGQRVERDVIVLENMQDPGCWQFANAVYRQNMFGDEVAEEEQRRRIDDGRRSMARDGNHSRQELDARRRNAQAFAVAAGRQAMQTGGQALYEEQMEGREEARRAEEDPEQNQDEGARAAVHDGMRAAYRRLQASNYLSRPPRTAHYRQLTLSDYLTTHGPSSPSASSTDSEPADRGLDAQDTGRPEAKSDEELRVQMECKICYTQLAEIACMPCGHLVMCRWCSEQHSPCLTHDRTRPRRAAACPVCRKGIRQKVRVFRA